MFTQNNVLHVQIAKDVARTANVQITDPSNATTYIANGEVVVTDVDGSILTTASTVDKFVIVQGRGAGNPLLMSPVIKKGKVLTYKAKPNAAQVEQVSYIGWNGASGEIEVIADNVYLARINRQDLQTTFGNKQMLKFGVYKSSASDLEEDIAKGLVDSFIANFKREAEPIIKFERVNEHAGSATTGATGTITFVKGSKTVTCSGGTPSTDFAVGDYVRFGTAVTSAVYKLTAVSDVGNGSLTLDVAYQGDSGSLAAASAEFITEAQAIANSFGIKLTGLAAKFVEGSFKYHKVRFNISLADFGSTAVTYDTIASEGVGEYEQVAELEWFAQGNEGKIERVGVPSPTSRKDAVLGEEYSPVTIEFYDDEMDGTIQGSKPSRKQFILAINVTDGTEGTSITDATNGVMTILDDQIVTDWGFGTAQAGNVS